MCRDNKKRTGKKKCTDVERPAARVSDSYPGMPEYSDEEWTPTGTSNDSFDPDSDEELSNLLTTAEFKRPGTDSDIVDEHIIPDSDYDDHGGDIEDIMLRACATPEEQKAYLVDEAEEVMDRPYVDEFIEKYVSTLELPNKVAMELRHRIDQWFDRNSKYEYNKDSVLEVIDLYATELMDAVTRKKPLSVELCKAHKFAKRHIREMDLPREQKDNLIKRVYSWLDDTEKPEYTVESIVEMTVEHAKYLPKNSK